MSDSAWAVQYVKSRTVTSFPFASTSTFPPTKLQASGVNVGCAMVEGESLHPLERRPKIHAAAAFLDFLTAPGSRSAESMVNVYSTSARVSNALFTREVVVCLEGTALRARAIMFSELERWVRRGAEIWRDSAEHSLGERVVELGERGVRSVAHRARRQAQGALAGGLRPALTAANQLRLRTRRDRVIPGSVLHISYLVHIPYYTTRVLRRQGVRADYLAVGRKSSAWDQCDYHFAQQGDLLAEFQWFWDVVAQYEVIHSHFGVMLSSTGWELPLLKALGRKIVVHYRGCEIRDRERNMALHPKVNICQVCDYNATLCRGAKARVERAQQYGDLFLVTTPDLQDFAPNAIHFPFFCPDIDAGSGRPAAPRGDRAFKIVHATNHPGIEGTAHLEQAVQRLQAKGHRVELVFLQGVTPERVLEEIRDADLTVGKLKMGYYANAQIESCFLGVPAVTFVRPDLRSPALERTGLILTDLDHLEATLEHYLTHPEALAEKRRVARASILALHDNERLARWLIAMYEALRAGQPVPREAP